MRNTLLSALTAALFAITGCGKQDYSDPEAFAEKYFREALEERYPTKEYMKPMHFKGIQLSNVKRQMKQTLFGQLEEISCEFAPVPEKGENYYCIWYYRNTEIDFGDSALLHFEFSNILDDVVSEAERKTLSSQIRQAEKKRPGLFHKDNPQRSHCTISAIRAKNGDGVYEPVNMGSGQFNFQGGLPSLDFCFTEERFKASGGFVLGTKEAKAALDAYRKKCAEIMKLAKELNNLADSLQNGILLPMKSQIRRTQNTYGFTALSHRRAITDMEAKLQRMENPDAVATRRRQRIPQNTAAKEARLAELRDTLAARKAQASRDKAAKDARIAFLESIIAFETGKLDKVEPIEGMDAEEARLISMPSRAIEIRAKWARLKVLLAEAVAKGE